MKTVNIALRVWSKSVTLYDSVMPQRFTFGTARALLENPTEFEKLNQGEKLNCARAVAEECSRELGIEPSNVYFAKYGFIKTVPAAVAGALSVAKTGAVVGALIGGVTAVLTGGLPGVFAGVAMGALKGLIVFAASGAVVGAMTGGEGGLEGAYFNSSSTILIKKSVNADDIKSFIPHEVKRHHQSLVLSGEIPAGIGAQPEKIAMWRRDSKYKYDIKPREIDANEYMVDFNERNFSPYRQLQLRKLMLGESKRKFDSTREATARQRTPW